MSFTLSIYWPAILAQRIFLKNGFAQSRARNLVYPNVAEELGSVLCSYWWIWCVTEL